MSTQSSAPDAPSTPRCAATTKDGTPCHAHPLPGSPFCPFHDPTRAHAFAAGRRQGGAASHRHPRRFPRLLDYRHVAELLGELFVDALNQADPADPHALRALNQLSRTLLQAVGRPKDSHIHYREREEPAPDQPHLLRVYRPLAPEVAAHVAAEPLSPAGPEPDADPSPASPAPVPEPELQSDALLGLPASESLDDAVRTLLRNRIPGLNHPELDAWLETYAAVRPWAAPELSLASMAVAASSPQGALQGAPQAVPQADHKLPTGDPATSELHALAALPGNLSGEAIRLVPPEPAPHETASCATGGSLRGRLRAATGGRRPAAPRRRR